MAVYLCLLLYSCPFLAYTTSFLSVYVVGRDSQLAVAVSRTVGNRADMRRATTMHPLLGAQTVLTCVDNALRLYRALLIPMS